MGLTLANKAFSLHFAAEGNVILREVLLNDALTTSAISGLSMSGSAKFPPTFFEIRLPVVKRLRERKD